MLQETAKRRHALIDQLDERQPSTKMVMASGRGDVQRVLAALQSIATEMPDDTDIQEAIKIVTEIGDCDKILDPEKIAIMEGLDGLDDGVKMLLMMAGDNVQSAYSLLVSSEKSNNEALEAGVFTDDDSREIAEIMKVDLPKGIELLKRAAVLDCVELV